MDSFEKEIQIINQSLIEERELHVDPNIKISKYLKKYRINKSVLFIERTGLTNPVFENLTKNDEFFRIKIATAVTIVVKANFEKDDAFDFLDTIGFSLTKGNLIYLIYRMVICI